MAKPSSTRPLLIDPKILVDMVWNLTGVPRRLNAVCHLQGPALVLVVATDYDVMPIGGSC